MLLLLSGVAACGASGQNADEATQRELKTIAVGVMENLEKGEFGKVTETFNKQVKDGLSADKLAGVWNSLPSQLGKYQDRGDAAYTRDKGFDTVSIVCRFEKQKIIFKCMFDKDKKIGGLWFLPE